MAEVYRCILLIVLLLLLFWMIGKTGAEMLKIEKLSTGSCVLLGTFFYYALFQIFALPAILLKRPFSELTAVWCVVLAILLFLFYVLQKKGRREKTAKVRLSGEAVGKTGTARTERKRSCLGNGNRTYRIADRKICLMVSPFFLLAAAAVLLQMYFTITQGYLGWDTSYYTGTVATTLARNSMYLYGSETGKAMSTINLRYALSAFYISAAFWCRLFSVRALYYVKITQAGVLVILSYTVIHRIGTVLLDRHHGRELQTGEKLADAGYAVVFLAVILHGMFDSIFSGSDFLLERAMEAKAYCANLVLPSVFLVCLRLWYEPDCLDLRKILLVITIAAVPISMSSLATVPAAVTAFFIPVLLRTRRGKDLLWYFCFILPEAVYMLLYFLYKLDILVIGV